MKKRWMIGMSLPPTKPIVPVLVVLAAIAADQERALPVLGHGADDIGRDRVRADVDQPELLVRERLGDRLHRPDHVEGRADDEVEALAGGARERRLKLRDRARLDHDIFDAEILLRLLHALVHHVVERLVAQARFRGDHCDATSRRKPAPSKPRQKERAPRERVSSQS